MESQPHNDEIMPQTKQETQAQNAKGYLRVKNWDQFQQYKDRDPKWIKLHREVLDDYELDSMSEVDQLHLIKIWLLAAKVENRIPNDPNWIARKIGAKSKVNLKQLVTLGFLVPYNSVQMTQVDLYLEEEEEAEKETDQRKDIGQQADRFNDFWQVYPKKVKKQEACKKWKLRKLDAKADQLIADVQTRLAKDGRWLEGFIPDPTTYINGSRWEDALQTPRHNGSAKPDWAQIPRADDDLWPWAKRHGYPNPGSLNYYQYRQTLQHAVEKRLNK